MLKVGNLVRIRQSFSQKKIGKLAIIVDKWNAWNVVINIVDTCLLYTSDAADDLRV